MFEFFEAGFEIHVKYKEFKELRQLNKITDWRQIVIKKKEPLPPPEEENPEGEGEEGEGAQEED